MKQSISYPDLDTPAVIIDIDKLETNIEDTQRLAGC